MERIIGRFNGQEKGPLFICFAAMHGNEPAGKHAIDLVFKMLEVEPISNPDFHYKGRFVGLIGNIQALQKGERFIEKDLNRQFTLDNISRVMNADHAHLKNEEKELRELIDTINNEIEDYQPEKILFLDLHTTSSHGGIFTISANDPDSIRIASALHAPVILGMTRGLRGTTMHFFNNNHFEANTISLTFESGQHEEKLSINRAISAIINCMKEINSVQNDHVENFHEEILIKYSDRLPKVAEMLERHPVYPEEGFEMLPGYKNFQFVRKGEVIAKDKNGNIAAKEDGLLLMPLYQKQGEDGFFIIKVVEARV
ncbi:MAG: succinylglutamate desuccinylase [Saprospiraceae bacterium]|nr:succinylglutamate desuccinylase [Saprospiraceae bacterium]